jgi:hypothetical protein
MTNFVFVPGSATDGRTIQTPKWQLMALRVDFSKESADYQLSSRNKCVQEGCRLRLRIGYRLFYKTDIYRDNIGIDIIDYTFSNNRYNRLSTFE